MVPVQKKEERAWDGGYIVGDIQYNTIGSAGYIIYMGSSSSNALSGPLMVRD